MSTQTVAQKPSTWPSIPAPPPGVVERDEHERVVSVPTVMNHVDQSTTLVSTRRNIAGSDAALEGAVWVPTPVRVYNARLRSCSLHRNGFELVSHKVSQLDIDYLDQNQVVEHYYPECEALVQRALRKCVKVKAFDHNVRSSQSGGEIKNGNGSQVQNPAGIVHADYTRVSAPRRIQALTEPPKVNDVLRLRQSGSLLDAQEVEEALQGKRRFALINLWRNIDPHEPVQELPLACIDASTVKWDDLKTFQIHYEDRIGENYFCCPSQKHRWMYFPEMVMDEALLLKQWDSNGGLAQNYDQDTEGETTFTVHSAFIDPSSPKDAPPRKSVEVRCVAIWDEE